MMGEDMKILKPFVIILSLGVLTVTILYLADKY
jgi:hypothetical protein